MLRVNPDKVRGWIKRGELRAVNVAGVRCGRPRLVVLPHHLAEFESRPAAAPPPMPPKGRKRTHAVDDYPGWDVRMPAARIEELPAEVLRETLTRRDVFARQNTKGVPSR